MKKPESIIIIIVLYKINLNDCLTFKTLTKYIENLNLNYQLIIYNNSSEINIPDSTSYFVVNQLKNEKLSGAYNYALEYAYKNNYGWLLLLDQDTLLTKEYFQRINDLFDSELLDNQDIVAVIPTLVENSKTLSPHKSKLFNLKKAFISNIGIQKGYVTAFNSLSLLRVQFMKSIGGFNHEFNLDWLDYWYYHQIYKQNKKIYVIDCQIKHQLSLNDYEQNISFTRHIDLLKAEEKFTKKLGKTYYFSYKIRLIIRLIKQLIFFKDKRYAQIIFKILINKL